MNIMSNQELRWHTEQRKVNELIPWEKNPRRMTSKQKENLQASLKRLNLISIPAIDIDNRIVSGHQRIKILQILGRGDEIIDVRVPNRKLTEEEFREANLRENKNMGEWDEELLKEFDPQELLDVGWTNEELTELFDDEMFGGKNSEGNTDPDAIPDPPAEPKAKYGDIYQLGRHRLMCGDSIKREDVERLMAGEKADMVFTSPPYSDQREYHIGNFSWDDLMFDVFSNILSLVINETTHIIVNLGLTHKNRAVDLYWDKWLLFMADHDYPLFGWYVWDKGCGIPGEQNGRLSPAHEFLFHFNKRCKSANKWIETKYKDSLPERIEQSKRSSRNRQKDGSFKPFYSLNKFGQLYKIPDSVIRISRAVTSGTILIAHPAVYPVALPEFGCKTWTQDNDLVFDPFGGSGTTIIAAEKNNRICYAMEISPIYIDIILQRWEEYTGQKVIKL